MKILHITVRADLGGGPRHIQYLLENIKNNVDSYVACPSEEPFFSIYKNLLGVDRVCPIPNRRITFSGIFKTAKYIQDNQIEIIHCHGRGAAVYGKIFKLFNPKLKFVFTPHGLNVSGNLFKRSLYKLFERLTQPLTTHIIFVSKSEQLLATKVRMFSGVKFSVIPNGVPKPLERKGFDVEEFKKEIFPNSDREIILSFSRYDFQKNMQETLAIAQQLPQFNFLWVGYGPDFECLKAEISELTISNIVLVGSQNDVFPYLAISNLYLSTARWEGMPLALLEALSMDIPIVASNVVGNKDIVTSEVGALYELGQIQSAVTSIKNILNPSDGGIKKENISKFFIDNYSSKVMSDKVLKIYNQVLS